MTRLVAIGVFLGLHAAATVAALTVYESVAGWMTGGYWVSPAVRVPLVIVAVVFVELLILSLCPACNRFLGRTLGGCGHAQAEHQHREMAASAR